jgi:hypothetical protein
LQLLKLWRAAFPHDPIIVGSYARWLVMRQKQLCVVFMCVLDCTFAHFIWDANRFHPAEFLDQLSVLDKDAERHRRKARRAAKHAD